MTTDRAARCIADRECRQTGDATISTGNVEKDHNRIRPAVHGNAHDRQTTDEPVEMLIIADRDLKRRIPWKSGRL